MTENIDNSSEQVTDALMTLIDVSSKTQKSEFGLLQKKM